MTTTTPLSASSSRMPDLPLTCLSTAEYTTTTAAFEGKNVVIDLWTTKCVRCPAALDDLDALSRRPEYAANVQFVSICLDSCDGARNIIERDDEVRWSNIRHYHMEVEHKEAAKQVLGFAQVPFYVVLNDRGEIVMKGSKKRVNFDEVPGVVRPAAPVSRSPEPEVTEDLVGSNISTPVKNVDLLRSGGSSSPTSVQQMEQPVFTLDEDF